MEAHKHPYNPTSQKRKNFTKALITYPFQKKINQFKRLNNQLKVSELMLRTFLVLKGAVKTLDKGRGQLPSR